MGQEHICGATAQVRIPANEIPLLQVMAALYCCQDAHDHDFILVNVACGAITYLRSLQVMRGAEHAGYQVQRLAHPPHGKLVSSTASAGLEHWLEGFRVLGFEGVRGRSRPFCAVISEHSYRVHLQQVAHARCES